MASQGRSPYVELAVQESPSNPSAAWLWKPKDDILGKEVNIRVGGSFVWPPTGVELHKVQNVVFVAGGVGIKYDFLSLDKQHHWIYAYPLAYNQVYREQKYILTQFLAHSSPSCHILIANLLTPTISTFISFIPADCRMGSKPRHLRLSWSRFCSYRDFDRSSVPSCNCGSSTSLYSFFLLISNLVYLSRQAAPRTSLSIHGESAKMISVQLSQTKMAKWTHERRCLISADHLV